MFQFRRTVHRVIDNCRCSPARVPGRSSDTAQIYHAPHTVCTSADHNHLYISFNPAYPPVIVFCCSFVVMDLLQCWLYLVACLRLFSVYTGYFQLSLFQDQVFRNAKSDVTPLAGRLFAVWTSLTCTLCLLTATHPHQHGR